MYDNARNGILQNLRRCKMYLNIDASCFSLLLNTNVLLQILMLYFVDVFGNISGWETARMNHLEQKSRSKLLNIRILHFYWIDLEDFNHLKPTGHVMHQLFNIQQLYALPHTVFMCFVFIWEQTATCATYSINWLVFITQMKSVYSAVRTGSLNQTDTVSSLKGPIS